MDTSANIFTPGVYHGRRDEDGNRLLTDPRIAHTVLKVQNRVEEDGEFCITNGLVGDHEDKMRRMMEYASDEGRIVERIMKLVADDPYVNLDFLCRSLANGARWSVPN